MSLPWLSPELTIVSALEFLSKSGRPPSRFNAIPSLVPMAEIWLDIERLSGDCNLPSVIVLAFYLMCSGMLQNESNPAQYKVLKGGYSERLPCTIIRDRSHLNERLLHLDGSG